MNFEELFNKDNSVSIHHNNIHALAIGTESAFYLGRNIWEQVPAEIKNKDSLDGFKKEIKKWKPTECPCRNCKTFVPRLLFDKNINISRIETSIF